LGRNWLPVTLIVVPAGPAATSSEINALVGIEGDGEGEVVGCPLGAGVGEGAATTAGAARTIQPKPRTKNPKRFMRSTEG
jgi:hypothetical protein